nr:PREDICTED: galactose-3-O-sulfotransferase 3 [Bos mutus]
MPPIFQRLQQATKMSRRKILLLVLGCSTLSLLIHQGAQLSWYPKLFPLSCPPLQDSPPRPKHMTVAFLKTHKTAGTTVQNILFRFAERHNLTVALPHPSCEHQFCYPRNFSAHFVHPATRPPHVLASHLRFDRAELQRLMPPGTVYVTILREPGYDLPSGRAGPATEACLKLAMPEVQYSSYLLRKQKRRGGMRLRPEPVLDNPPPRPIRALRPGH